MESTLDAIMDNNNYTVYIDELYDKYCNAIFRHTRKEQSNNLSREMPKVVNDLH